MDYSSSLDVFRKGIARIGSIDIAPGMFDCPPSVLIDILKNGFRPVKHDLVMLVSALMGLGSRNVAKIAASIINFSEGKVVKFDDLQFDKMNCVIIKVYDCENINRICDTISLLSDNDGETWSGSIKGIVRTLPLAYWVKMYYGTFLEALAYTRSPFCFDKDFRFVAAYKPSGGSFVPYQIFQVDNRSIGDIAKECTNIYGPGSIVPKYTLVDENKQPKVKPPPRPPKLYPVKLDKSNPKTPSPGSSPRKNIKRPHDEEEKEQSPKRQKTEDKS